MFYPSNALHKQLFNTLQSRICNNNAQQLSKARLLVHNIFSQCFSTNYIIREAPHTQTIQLSTDLPLKRGGVLSGPLPVNYSQMGNPQGPIIYIMPSLSHSAHAATPRQSQSSADTKARGWWEDVAGYGTGFGIDLNIFRLICASPLGNPYGSVSPLTNNSTTKQPYRGSFPVITPRDQAELHFRLMQHLNLPKIYCVIGASMGGMAALQFAVHYSAYYERCVAICTTTRTTPSTVALRSVQRAAVISDTKYNNGDYEGNNGPAAGMRVARHIGTIAYRSRTEFDGRFAWRADPVTHKFEVERYLDHVGQNFSQNYDANCYISCSRAMDLQDITEDFNGNYKRTVENIESVQEKQFMILPINQDALIQAHECEEFSQELGSAGAALHYERLNSLYGHDAFLKEAALINPRLSEFLTNGQSKQSGPAAVRAYLHQLLE
jgi:homoserine O-acetyltransferase